MKLIFMAKAINPVILVGCDKLFSIFAFQIIAQVAELVDALDSKSSFFGSVGSIPTLSTNRGHRPLFFLPIYS